MNQNLKIVAILFIYLLSTSFIYGHPKTMNDSPDSLTQTIYDSLQQQLTKTTQKDERIHLLKEIANLYYNTEKEPFFLEKIYYEAQRNRNYQTQSWALKNIIRNFNNHNNHDSLVHWYKKEKKLVKKMGTYDDNYFYMTQMYCHSEIWHNNIVNGIQAAIELYDAASENHSNYAKMVTYENNAYIYQRLGQDSLAIVYYNKTLEHALKEKNKDHDYILGLYSYIIDSNITLKRFDDAIAATEKYRSIIEKRCKNKKRNCKVPYEQGIASANLYSLIIYSKMGDLKSADQYYRSCNIKNFTSNLPWDTYIRSLYYDASAKYFLQKKEYRKALKATQLALKENGDAPAMAHLQADIYSRMGYYKKANDIYQELVQYKDKINQLIILQQLHEMRRTHQENEAKFQLKEAEMNLKQQQFFVTIGITAFLVILLIIFIYYNRRLNKLQVKLKAERVQLIKAKDILSFAKIKAEESDKLKSLFLANMSHEIRTPLNAICGFSSLIIDKNIDSEEKIAYTNIVQENSKILLNLINDVLDVSKLEAERYHFELAPCDINDCCKQSILTIKGKMKRNVRLSFTPKMVKNVHVTDRLRLQQVLINLLANASKFTQKGSIKLDYYLNEKENLIYFSVTDTGIGIPAIKHDKVFNRFEKLDSFTQGTGLGLPICQLIVEQFGGKIWIDKTYTKGARFIFTHAANLKGNL